MYNKDKQNVYSFRKFKDGRTESALIGATVFAIGLSLLTSQGVSANEVEVETNKEVTSAVVSTPKTEVITKVEAVAQPKIEDKVTAVSPSSTETPKVEDSETKKNEVVKGTNGVSTIQPSPSTEEEKQVSLDKSQLESYISEVEGKLANGSYSNKTEDSLTLLTTELSAARSTLLSATSQEELTSAYNKLLTTVSSKLKNKLTEKNATTVDTTEGKPTKGIQAENTDPTTSEKLVGSKDKRNGKSMEIGSGLRSATEGYTLETTEKRHENGEFSTATGKSYKVLDNNDKYKLYIQGYQSENTDRPSTAQETPATGGRTDIPLSKTEAEKLRRESVLWDGRIRPTEKKNHGAVNRMSDKALDDYLDTLKRDGNSRYGANGSYEFLATEIYGYTYEQGKHYIYVPNAKNRFTLSQEAQDAGYRISEIGLSNLIPGLGYNEKTDTIEGYVATTIQNGVYDMRYEVTVTKPDNTTQKFSFANLTAGWMGWQDTTPPTIEGSSTMVKIGDEVSHDLKYLDNPGMAKDDRANYQYAVEIKDPNTNKFIKTEDNGGRVDGGSQTKPKKDGGLAYFTAQDGSRIRTMNSPRRVPAHTTLNGQYTGGEVSIADVVPGLSYNPTTGLITGTATESGIFTMAAQAKDYNNTTNSNNKDWTAYGQETHENITIAVAPKVSISNVEAYSTSVPITISNGANTAEITMPDGTVTKLAVKSGKWVVAEGTTNTAVTVGTELGEASATTPFKFDLAVTSDATQYAGVDTIVAKSTTDQVKANLQREVVTVRDADGQTHTATFNRATGKFQLPNEEAYVLTDNQDGTTTLKERRVYTDLKADGNIDYIVYEFTRTWNSTSTATNLVDKVEEIRKNGEVKKVLDVTRTVTTVPKDQTATTEGIIVTVTYDSVSGTWSASDGSKVTAIESNAGWSIQTSSGFKGYVSYRSAVGHDVGSIQNAKPTGSSTDYEAKKKTIVDLLKSSKANVGFTDVIDDKSSDEQSETIVTKLTVVAPDGTQKVFDGAQAEEIAYIQAQRTQAEKNKLAVEAVKTEQSAKNELARLQELIDRQIQYNTDAQSSLDNLRLRTISITAKELAEGRLSDGKAKLAKLQAELATKQGELPSLQAKVTETRTAALESERDVETKREALKVAAKKNLENAELTAYTLSQVGQYTVTVRAVDSNGIVTTPTVGGEDSGEVTEDAVAETTYHITVPLVKAPVVVNHYKDGTTEKLAPSEDKGKFPIDDPYTTEPATIPPKTETEDTPEKTITRVITYTLKEMPSDKDGIVPEEGKVVNYYYVEHVETTEVAKKAPVVANYFIENTTDKLAPSDDQGQKDIGSGYTTETKVIEPKVETEDLPDRVVTKTTKYELVKVPEDKEGKVPVEGKVVNYYYRPVVTTETVMKKAPVLVNYYLVNTTEKLAPSDDQGQKEIGSKYTSETKVIEPKVEVEELPNKTITKTTTYELVAVPEDKEGTVPVEGKVVNYYYHPAVSTTETPKQAPVIVHHLLEGTTEKLADDENQGLKNIDSNYTTDSANIPPKVEVQDLADRVVTKTTTYELVSEPTDKTGTVPPEGKEVTYYYRSVVKEEVVRKQAPVVVNHYEDGTTTKLADSVDKGKFDIGSGYTTESATIPPKVDVQELPNKTVTTTTTWTLKEEPSDKNGTVPVEGKVVNYYYVKNVKVTEVPKQAPVLVNYYKDGTTEKLSPSDAQGLKDIDSKYTTEKRDIPPVVEVEETPEKTITKTTTWVLKEVPKDAEGIVPVGGKVVDYYYVPKVTVEEVKKQAPVTVNYYKDGTTESLVPSENQGKKEIGSKYTTEPKVVPPVVTVEETPEKTITTTTKWVLKAVPKDKDGDVPVGGKVVNYYYVKEVDVKETKKQAPVTVNYYKEGTTTLVSPSENLGKHDIGGTYTTEPKTIQPVVTVEETPEKRITKTVTYELVKVPEDKDGKVPSEGKVVNYYYKEVVKVDEIRKRSSIVVHHYLEGTTIPLSPSSSQTDLGVGTSYRTESRNIPNKVEYSKVGNKEVVTTTTYELVSEPTNKVGSIVPTETVVTYYYHPVVVTEEYPTVPNDAPKVEVPSYDEPIGTIPNDAPKVDIPEYTEPIGVPGTPEVHEKPEFEGGVTPLDPPVVEIPEYTEPIGTVPNDNPKVEIPSYTVPIEHSNIPEVPEKPNYDKPIKPTPNDVPNLEVSELKVPDKEEKPKIPNTPVTSTTTVITDVTPQQVETPKVELPNTGLEDSSGLAALGLVGLFSSLGLTTKLRNKD